MRGWRGDGGNTSHLAACHELSGPPCNGGDSETAFPHIALGAFQVGVGLEIVWTKSTLLMGAVVRGENDQSVVVDLQILQRLKKIRHRVVQSADHRHMSFGIIRPSVVDRGMPVCDIINVRNVISSGVRVRRRTGPLDAARDTFSSRIIFGGWILEDSVRRVVGEIDEKGAVGMVAGLVNDGLLGKAVQASLV